MPFWPWQVLQSSVLVAVGPVAACAPVAPSQLGVVGLVPGHEWQAAQSYVLVAVYAEWSCCV